jgi:hypothetical protein
MKYWCDLYEYVLVHTSVYCMYFVTQVRTEYILIFLSTYLVNSGMYCAHKNIAGDAFFMLYACGKRYCVCVPCTW